MFIKLVNEQLIRQLNQVYLVINDVVHENAESQLAGIPASKTFTFLKNLPFFVVIPHFLSRDITSKILYATVIE